MAPENQAREPLAGFRSNRFKSITAKKWRQMYLSARTVKGSCTFKVLYARFRFVHGYTPPLGTPLTPSDPLDMYRLVADIPEERLYGPISKAFWRDHDKYARSL